MMQRDKSQTNYCCTNILNTLNFSLKDITVSNEETPQPVEGVMYCLEIMECSLLEGFSITTTTTQCAHILHIQVVALAKQIFFVTGRFI